ncbi:DUF6234 family protein [Streptomyces sp. NPDC058195]|uniref:DUF6234 family protein n=1 Tax=Streptomyces sp. NPDC058195 TaxID=3346375 RepID=UPI0036EA840B
MTDSPPAPGTHRPASVNGCLDAAPGLALLLLEGAVCAVVLLPSALSRSGPGAPEPERAEPPPVFWPPVLVSGASGAVTLLFAVVLTRSRWPLAGRTQLVAVPALSAMAVPSGAEDAGRARPPVAPAPSHMDGPGHRGHPYLGGGNSRGRPGSRG